MQTLNTETAPVLPEVAASGGCRSNPTNHEVGEVYSMMSHPAGTNLPMAPMENRVRSIAGYLSAFLNESVDAPLFVVVDVVAALEHLDQAVALLQEAELIATEAIR